MRTWFFSVIVIALGITLNAVLRTFNIPNAFFMGLGLALIFAYFKIIKRNLIVHNLTELFIYAKKRSFTFCQLIILKNASI